MDGYTILFIFSLISLTVGFFLLLREFEVGIIESMLLGFVFVFNGSLSLRWVHLNLLQTFSLLPFLFYISLRYLREGRKRFLLASSLIISQMVFAGHTQTVFIGVLALFLWLLFLNIPEKRRIVFLFASFIVGVFISLPQILPTYLLSQNSTRPFQLDYQLATSFPLTWTHLVSFFNPFPFGNPKYGTYPIYSANWGIFWENTPYLGRFFLPIFLFSFVLLKKKADKKNILIYGLLFTIFTLLALGKNSPIYFIFNFFPFNLFRTPSKYLIMSSFFILCAMSLMIRDAMKNKIHALIKLSIIFLICLNIFDLVRFAFDYHLFVKSDDVLKAPAAARSIPGDRYYVAIDPYTGWNALFLKKGWPSQRETDQYLFMKNFLYPNSNLIFDRSIYAINTGAFHLRRPEYIKSFIEKSIQKEKGVVAPYIQNLLQIIGIDTIVSGFPLKGEAIKQKEVLIKDETKIHIYAVADSNKNWYYVPKKVQKIEYIDDFEKKLINGEITLQKAVAEGFKRKENNDGYVILNEKSSNTRYELKGSFAKDTFVIFRINYYPEWSVLIDNKKTGIYKANITQMGVIVPPGVHTIIIRYENSYFRAGLVISLFVAGGYLLLLQRSKQF